MRYLGKLVGGQATRNNFIRSMDLDRNRTADEALEAYSDAWFSSTRKQYLNEALKLSMQKSLFWTSRALCDMLDEVQLNFEGDADGLKALARDVDLLKSKICAWAAPTSKKQVSDKDMVAAVKAFEAKHRYACPETYRSCWMNTGAYVTLAYGIKYEGLSFPGCATPEACLDLLKKFALEVIADMDHNVDERLFRLCHEAYLERLEAMEKPGGTQCLEPGAARP